MARAFLHTTNSYAWRRSEGAYMSGQLGSLVIELSADIARFREDMGKATKISQETASGMAKALDGVHSSIGSIGKDLPLLLPFLLVEPCSRT
jgi:hypothetical protein